MSELEPVRIGIITAGRTDKDVPDAELAALGVKLRTDLKWFPEEDVKLWDFLYFCFAASKARAFQRPTEFYILGGASDQTLISEALERLAVSGIDLLIWWTFTPIIPGNAGNHRVSRAFDALALCGAHAVYPCSLPVDGRHQNLPGFISCGGALVKKSRLVLAASPSFPGLRSRPLQTMPKVISYGSWPKFRSSWLSLGLPYAMFPDSLDLEGHTLALWSIAATATRIMGLVPSKMAGADLEKLLSACCVDVDLSFPAKEPKLGFLDPRQAAKAGIL